MRGTVISIPVGAVAIANTFFRMVLQLQVPLGVLAR